MKRSGLKAITGTAAAGVAGLLAYRFLVRPWHLSWGSTEEEVQRKMPGDEIIEEPDYISTRTITINAEPKDIYPWLVQIGQGRGGAYSYDWIENILGLDIHSVDEIVPELQDLKVGDTIPLEPGGEGLEVKILERDRFLILVNPEEGWTWGFGLYPAKDGKTRLVSRNRFSLKDTSFGFRFYLKIVEPGAFIMERKMLLGIKERVENTVFDTQSRTMEDLLANTAGK